MASKGYVNDWYVYHGFEQAHLRVGAIFALGTTFTGHLFEVATSWLGGLVRMIVMSVRMLERTLMEA